jgi:hypothetical protein
MVKSFNKKVEQNEDIDKCLMFKLQLFSASKYECKLNQYSNIITWVKFHTVNIDEKEENKRFKAKLKQFCKELKRDNQDSEETLKKLEDVEKMLIQKLAERKNK